MKENLSQIEINSDEVIPIAKKVLELINIDDKILKEKNEEKIVGYYLKKKKFSFSEFKIVPRYTKEYILDNHKKWFDEMCCEQKLKFWHFYQSRYNEELKAFCQLVSKSPPNKMLYLDLCDYQKMMYKFNQS